LHSARSSQTRQMNGSPRKAQKAPRLQPKTREMNAPTRQALKAPNLFRQRTLLHHLWCRSRKMKSTTWGSATPRAALAQRKYPISRGNRNGYLCRHASLFLSRRAVHSKRIASGQHRVVPSPWLRRLPEAPSKKYPALAGAGAGLSPFSHINGRPLASVPQAHVAVTCWPSAKRGGWIWVDRSRSKFAKG
jgi:hypothetical protein